MEVRVAKKGKTTLEIARSLFVAVTQDALKRFQDDLVQGLPPGLVTAALTSACEDAANRYKRIHESVTKS